MRNLFDGLTAYNRYMPLAGAPTRYFEGRVLNNEDTKRYGRIKCQIPTLLDFDDYKKLPWIYPLFPAGTGASPIGSEFSVPEVDSQVICVFPYESIYQGYYMGQTLNKKNRTVDFMSEYPERYGRADSVGNKTITNKDPDIDVVESRYSDGSLSIWDSRNSTWTFSDKWGTKVYLDRKAQSLNVKFGGMSFVIMGGKDSEEDGAKLSDIVGQLEISGDRIKINAHRTLSIVGKKLVNFSGNVVNAMGDFFGGMNRRG